MMKIIRSFFRKKTLINAIPRYIIFIILNLRYLKKYNTLNGSFYLPFFAFQDVIRNTIIKNKIQCPALILWGERSDTGRVWGDVLNVWQQYCETKVVGKGIDCGHYLQEEEPENVFNSLKSFL